MMKESRGKYQYEKNMKENADGFLNNYNINLNKDYETEYRKMLISNNSLKTNLNLTDNILREKLTEFRKNTAKDRCTLQEIGIA